MVNILLFTMGLVHVRWLFGISSINSVIRCLVFSNKRMAMKKSPPFVDVLYSLLKIWIFAMLVGTWSVTSGSWCSYPLLVGGLRVCLKRCTWKIDGWDIGIVQNPETQCLDGFKRFVGWNLWKAWVCWVCMKDRVHLPSLEIKSLHLKNRGWNF